MMCYFCGRETATCYTCEQTGKEDPTDCSIPICSKCVGMDGR